MSSRFLNEEPSSGLWDFLWRHSNSRFELLEFLDIDRQTHGVGADEDSMSISARVVDVLDPETLEKCQYLAECVEEESSREGPAGISGTKVSGRVLTPISLSRLGAHTNFMFEPDDAPKEDLGDIATLNVNQIGLLECDDEGPLGYAYFHMSCTISTKSRVAEYKLCVDEAWIMSGHRGIGHGIALASALGSHFANFVYTVQLKMGDSERRDLIHEIQTLSLVPHPSMESFVCNMMNAATRQYESTTRWTDGWTVRT